MEGPITNQSASALRHSSEGVVAPSPLLLVLSQQLCYSNLMPNRVNNYLMQAGSDLEQARRFSTMICSKARRLSAEPVRSLIPSVFVWPNAHTVHQAVRNWAERVGRSRKDVQRIGYFGSYARGDWEVGSDLDLIVIVRDSHQPLERKGGSVGCHRDPCSRGRADLHRAGMPIASAAGPILPHRDAGGHLGVGGKAG